MLQAEAEADSYYPGAIVPLSEQMVHFWGVLEQVLPETKCFTSSLALQCQSRGITSDSHTPQRLFGMNLFI